MISESLTSVAERLGVIPAYRDAFGRQCVAGVDAMLAVTGVLAGCPGAGEHAVVGAAVEMLGELEERLVPPVVVSWSPGPVVVTLGPGVQIGDQVEVSVALDPRVEDRGWSNRTWPTQVETTAGAPVIRLDGDPVPIGRHGLMVCVGDRAEHALLLVAPERLAPLPDQGRLWGVFAPVWSCWEGESTAVCLDALDTVGRWAGGFGAGLVGTLPLLSTFLDEPFEPSPYSPVSRRHWDESLINVSMARQRVGRKDATVPTGNGVTLEPGLPWDRRSQWRQMRPLLADLAQQVDGDEGLRRQLDTFLKENPEVVRYGCFRAEVERTGSGWRDWPRAARDGHLTAQPNDADARFWACSQWLVRDQLNDLDAGFRGRRQALYLDLAIGAHAEGFDTWAEQSLYASGVTVGAPPDRMFPHGQDWGFPPVLPGEGSADGHEEFSAALATHLAISRVLRLDHVMGLQRLFWIPDGMDPLDGVYVRQPLEELLAVVCIEASFGGAAVVGEDLGTVDPGIVEAMRRHGLHGMYVGQFEVPEDAAEGFGLPQPTALASLNTHDTPTFAGWCSATDITERRDAGVLDAHLAADQRRARGRQVEALSALLGVVGLPGGPRGDGEDDERGVHPHPLLGAFLTALAASEAAAVMVSLDDLVGSLEPQNIPGTPATRPNWVTRLPVPFSELAGTPSAAAILRQVGSARARTQQLNRSNRREP